MIILILAGVLLVVSIIGMISYVFMLARNSEVLYLRLDIIKLAASYDIRHKLLKDTEYEDAFEWFVKKYTYNNMLYSFKPLKLEYWYSKEELDKINS